MIKLRVNPHLFEFSLSSNRLTFPSSNFRVLLTFSHVLVSNWASIWERDWLRQVVLLIIIRLHTQLPACALDSQHWVCLLLRDKIKSQSECEPRVLLAAVLWATYPRYLECFPKPFFTSRATFWELSLCSREYCHNSFILIEIFLECDIYAIPRNSSFICSSHSTSVFCPRTFRKTHFVLSKYKQR